MNHINKGRSQQLIWAFCQTVGLEREGLCRRKEHEVAELIGIFTAASLIFSECCSEQEEEESGKESGGLNSLCCLLLKGIEVG